MFKVPSFIYCLLLLLIIPIFLLGKYLKEEKYVYQLSFILLLLEIFKQIYLIINHKWSVWYIPFQLCSMPIYLCLFKRNYYLKFIKTYSLLGAIAAICYPMDMISHGIVLCIHSYLFHYIIILMSAIIYFNKLDNKSTFKQATYLFLIMCLIATILNIIFTKFGEINMFYINFAYHNYQPILNKITNTYLANTIYILVIIIVSYLIEHFI